MATTSTANSNARTDSSIIRWIGGAIAVVMLVVMIALARNFLPPTNSHEAYRPISRYPSDTRYPTKGSWTTKVEQHYPSTIEWIRRDLHVSVEVRFDGDDSRIDHMGGTGRAAGINAKPFNTIEFRIPEDESASSNTIDIYRQ
ncbi:MAG TPA: hypothetical protein VJH55_04005 [Candidatus Paceibacterota bacterium]